MKNKHFLKQFSVWMRAFMILALVFLAIGLGTLGSVHGVGKSYRLPHQRSGDGLVPAIVVRLQDEGHGDENHEHRDLYIKEVYVNVGTIYSEYGDDATLRVAYGTSTSSKFYTYNELVFSNLYKETVEEDGAVTKTPSNMLYNWVKVPFATEEGYRLAVYPYWQFTARNCDIVINEVVFIANEKDNSGKSVILNAEINTEITNLPEKDEVLVKKAGAIIDKQHRPSLAQSSYFNFGREEVHVITTYMEMKQSRSYAADNVYHMDNIYNTFGLDLMFIGPAIFGLSPFGLRFMPMLASFGVLVFGFLFIKRLTGSEKAAFVFAVLFALCGLSLSLAHLGTPLMIGVFFFVASLYYCHGFFLNGMKKANFASAVPLILSAVFAAAAVCTHGAFIVPVLGIVGLFIAGVIRQRRALNAQIEIEAQKAIEEENAAQAEATETAEAKEEPVYTEGRKRVAKLVNEKIYKHSVAIGVFCTFLVLGYLLMSILSILPLYSTYVKVHDDPTSPARSIFYFLWLAFSGGFAGSNSALATASPFSFAYELYHGTGNLFAVTATGTLVGAVAILLGLAGAIYTFVSIARKKTLSAYNYAAFILLYGFVLALITAFFAASGIGFLFLAALFLFGYAALCFAEKDDAEGSDVPAKSVPKAVTICGLALLMIWFLACAVLTFSIPLPAWFMNIFFG